MMVVMRTGTFRSENFRHAITVRVNNEGIVWGGREGKRERGGRGEKEERGAREAVLPLCTCFFILPPVSFYSLPCKSCNGAV